MRFFVDTNVLVYPFSTAPHAGPCTRLLGSIAAGEADGLTSVLTLEEAWHLALTQRLRSGAIDELRATFASPLGVGVQTFDLARELDAEVGAMDRLHAATCIENGIELIVTADRGFDSISALRRVDPLDATAMDSLVTA